MFPGCQIIFLLVYMQGLVCSSLPGGWACPPYVFSLILLS